MPLTDETLGPVGVVALVALSGVGDGSSGLIVEVEEDRPKLLVSGAR